MRTVWSLLIPKKKRAKKPFWFLENLWKCLEISEIPKDSWWTYIPVFLCFQCVTGAQIYLKSTLSTNSFCYALFASQPKDSSRFLKISKDSFIRFPQESLKHWDLTYMHMSLVFVFMDNWVGNYVCCKKSTQRKALKETQSLQSWDLADPVRLGSEVVMRKRGRWWEMLITTRLRIPWQKYRKQLRASNRD